jgi:hypothetical protein
MLQSIVREDIGQFDGRRLENRRGDPEQTKDLKPWMNCHANAATKESAHPRIVATGSGLRHYC